MPFFLLASASLYEFSITIFCSGFRLFRSFKASYGQDSILGIGQRRVNVLEELGDFTKDSLVVLILLFQEVLNNILPDLYFFVEFEDPNDYLVCFLLPVHCSLLPLCLLLIIFDLLAETGCFFI